MTKERVLLQYAKDMRNGPTPLEARLWAQLSRSQLGGHKFRRQHVIDNVICDFFCPSKGLIVEIDGDTHDPTCDTCRDERMKGMGYSTLRFTNRDIRNNIEGVLVVILNQLEQLPDRWQGAPHPNPSPEGEGREE